MNNVELFRSALDGLKSHKLRSGLTATGVIFGVAAVIGMASIGEGARREALRMIEQMGASNIVVSHSRPEEGDDRTASYARNPSGLTLADAESIRELVPDARQVLPIKAWNDVNAHAGGLSAKLNVIATTPEVFSLYDLSLQQGRKFTALDEEGYRRVCVLGWESKRELFPLTEPLGEDVLLYDQLFTVVGVLERRAAGGGEIEGVELHDFNTDIYIPLATALKRSERDPGESELDNVVVHISEPSMLPGSAQLIERILMRRHREVADFNVVVPEELLRQHQATQRIFNIVMGAIASISLIVGGIGIMNIMLASVLERTREIGVRRAVGARQSDIARQFLLEAVLLSVSGGVVGVILGILLAHGISVYAQWETAVSVWAVFVAVGVSVGVGVIFGWLPARQAARLDPITALRYE